MRVKLIRYEIERKRNVFGKVISCRYEYIIMVKRLFKRPTYLRLLPGWEAALKDGKPVGAELTRARYNATTFRENNNGQRDLGSANLVIAALKENPDKFIIQ